jgi:hypothetical protein
MHVEIAFDLATFLGKQHREEEPGAEHPTEHGQQTCACARLECPRVAVVLSQQPAPHLYVPVFDLGQAAIEVFLFGIRLGVRQQSVEVRRVGLVLPMVLEGVEVGRSGGVGRHAGKVIGCWMVTGYWLLVAGYWLLVAGCWLVLDSAGK